MNPTNGADNSENVRVAFLNLVLERLAILSSIQFGG